jgi:hypothetical protein
LCWASAYRQRRYTVLKMIKYTLLLLLFINLSIYSQKPDIGMSIGLSYLNTNEYNNISPFNLSFNLRQEIVENTNIKFNIGLAFYAEEYGGLDFNLLLENELYKKLKIIGGINAHMNGGVSHGTMTYTETYSKTFYHYVLGFGINITNHSSVDLLLMLPSNREFGYSNDHSYEVSKTNYKYLDYILKLGINFYF